MDPDGGGTCRAQASTASAFLLETVRLPQDGLAQVQAAPFSRPARFGRRLACGRERPVLIGLGQRRALDCAADREGGDSVEIRCFAAPEAADMFFFIRLSLADISDAVDPCGARPCAGLHCTPFTDDPVVAGFAQVLLPAWRTPDRVNNLFLDHVVCALSAHVASAYGEMHIPAGHGGLAGWQRQRATDLLTSRFCGHLSNAELAAACRLSVGHFIRAFRQSFGTTPHRWLLGYRVQRACELLRDPQRPLAEIALATGFADQTHLTHVFSRTLGRSPAVWRRERLD